MKTSPWSSFIQNLVIYLIALFISMFAFTIFRFPWMLALMWGIGLIGIVFLAVQAARLMAGGEKERVQARARLETYREQAWAYKKQIDQTIKGGSAAHQQRLQKEVDSWIEAIEDLIERVSGLRQDSLIQRDMQRVPQAIEELEDRLATESQADFREQLERTLDNRQKQWAALEDLQNSIRRAEIQIESTVSMLGTIYSQLLTSQSTSDVADYSHLSAEVDEEVHRLQDHLEALREVKLTGQ